MKNLERLQNAPSNKVPVKMIDKLKTTGHIIDIEILEDYKFPDSSFEIYKQVIDSLWWKQYLLLYIIYHLMVLIDMEEKCFMHFIKLTNFVKFSDLTWKYECKKTQDVKNALTNGMCHLIETYRNFKPLYSLQKHITDLDNKLQELKQLFHVGNRCPYSTFPLKYSDIPELIKDIEKVCPEKVSLSQKNIEDFNSKSISTSATLNQVEESEFDNLN
jgi:hypothetical protein